MSRIFIVSDTHFGHTNFLRFVDDNGERIRPFDTVKELDELMVQNWNNTVTNEDIVYHLGDVYFGEGHRVLHRLQGRKRLILGNHDNSKDQHLMKYFQKITMWRQFREFNCLLTHVPVHESTLFKVNYNLHGHIHANPSPKGPYVNCSVEVQNYTPKLIEELVPNIVFSKDLAHENSKD